MSQPKCACHGNVSVIRTVFALAILKTFVLALANGIPPPETSLNSENPLQSNTVIQPLINNNDISIPTDLLNTPANKDKLLTESLIKSILDKLQEGDDDGGDAELLSRELNHNEISESDSNGDFSNLDQSFVDKYLGTPETRQLLWQLVNNKQSDLPLFDDGDQVIGGLNKRRLFHLKRKWGSFNSWGKKKRSLPSGLGSLDKRWGKNGMQVWGKRDSSAEDSRKRSNWANSMSSWGKRSDNLKQDNVDETKRWSNGLQSWGKRENDIMFNPKSKKWAKSMNTWGKRNLDIDKKWAKNMNVWGKRNLDSDDIDKKWAKNMNVWGKRNLDTDEIDKKWAKNMNVWGKRNLDSDDIDKKWAKNMNVWGKRDLNDVDMVKKWSRNLNTWGKRDFGIDANKRWGKNNMQVWGKRDSDNSDNVISNEKKWSSTSSLNTWGKRFSDNHKNGIITKRSNHDDSYETNPDISASSDVAESVKTMQAAQRRRRKREAESMYGGVSFKNTAAEFPENPEKRRWNRMHVWGKRTEFPFFGGPKRGWKANEMKVWGKRSWDDEVRDRDFYYNDMLSPGYVHSPNKRLWKSTMSVWG